MKVRLGFVSNSSSSSYTCQICQQTESGWDICLSECGMYQGECGHVFCESHIKDISDPEDMEIGEQLALLNDLFSEDEEWYKEAREKHAELLSMTAEQVEENDLEDDVSQLIAEWCSDWRYELPDKYCPICVMTEVTDGAALRYALHKLGISRKKLDEEIQSRFSSLSELNGMIADGDEDED